MDNHPLTAGVVKMASKYAASVSRSIARGIERAKLEGYTKALDQALYARVELEKDFNFTRKPKK